MVLGANAALGQLRRRTGIALDPFKSYSFFVEVEGLLVGGFRSVRGLESKIEVKTVREGGVNDTEYQLPGQVTYSNITLEAGLTALDPVWLWYKSSIEGKAKRKNGSIYLLNDQGIPGMWWDFYNAWPVEWKGPEFDAMNNTVAAQTFVLAHEGIKKSLTSQLASAAIGLAL
jgi:phage tail-like protein